MQEYHTHFCWQMVMPCCFAMLGISYEMVLLLVYLAGLQVNFITFIVEESLTFSLC